MVGWLLKFGSHLEYMVPDYTGVYQEPRFMTWFQLGLGRRSFEPPLQVLAPYYRAPNLFWGSLWITIRHNSN